MEVRIIIITTTTTTNDDIPKTLKGLLMYLFMNRTDRPPVLVLHDVVLKYYKVIFKCCLIIILRDEASVCVCARVCI